MKSINELTLSLLGLIVVILLMGADSPPSVPQPATTPPPVSLPDPTRPPGVSTTSSIKGTVLPQRLELTAIFVYPSYKVAIINGQPVKVGDQLDQYTVTTIEPNTVELTGPQNSKEILELATKVKTNSE